MLGVIGGTGLTQLSNLEQTSLTNNCLVDVYGQVEKGVDICIYFL